jgi:hypothetical protein
LSLTRTFREFPKIKGSPIRAAFSDSELLRQPIRLTGKLSGCRAAEDGRTGSIKEKEMVPRGGIEPPTLRFSVACSTN